jgi:hypothetical protein
MSLRADVGAGALCDEPFHLILQELAGLEPGSTRR